MKSKRMNKGLIGIVFSLFLLISTYLGGLVSFPVSAAVSKYTGVLEDLQKDSAFDASAFPDNEVDYRKSEYAKKFDFYSIHLIQIAESANKELFLYTYQPSQKILPLFATCVNMSPSGDYSEYLTYDPNFGNDFIGHTGSVSDSNLGDGGGIGGSSGGGGGGGGSRPCSLELDNSSADFRLFDLTLLNSSGVFCKYKVNAFITATDSVRYYNIASILRKWNKFVDTHTTATEVAVKVGECWTAETVGDKVHYVHETIDVVEILNPFPGSVRYGEGFDWWKATACDSHFIAFNTDWDISRLLEAEVSFEYRKYDKGMYGETADIVWTSMTRTVTYEQRAHSNANVFGGKKARTWDRIQTGKEFVDSCDVLDEKVAADILSRQWVLSYFETDYEDETGGVFGLLCWCGNIFGYKYQHGTHVRGVTVLRLKFISEGQVYNLGAVSDKGGSSDIVGSDYIDFGGRVWEIIKNFAFAVANWFRSVIKQTPWWVWLIVGVVAAALVVAFVAWIIHKVRNKS